MSTEPGEPGVHTVQDGFQSPTDLVLNTISLACGIEPADVGEQSRLADLGVDSFTIFAVVSRAEALYSATLSDDQVVSLFQSEFVSDLIAFVNRLRSHHES